MLYFGGKKAVVALNERSIQLTTANVFAKSYRPLYACIHRTVQLEFRELYFAHFICFRVLHTSLLLHKPHEDFLYKQIVYV